MSTATSHGANGQLNESAIIWISVYAPKMTIMTIKTISGGGAMGTQKWTVAEAKAKFSEVIERAQTDGPQTITRNGKKAAVVVAAEEWERKTKRRGNLAEFFASSPLRGLDLKVKRVGGRVRKLEL
jgi:prevent-host-death family protein